jgi:hypothetical protein
LERSIANQKTMKELQMQIIDNDVDDRKSGDNTD